MRGFPCPHPRAVPGHSPVGSTSFPAYVSGEGTPTPVTLMSTLRGPLALASTQEAWPKAGLGMQPRKASGPQLLVFNLRLSLPPWASASPAVKIARKDPRGYFGGGSVSVSVSPHLSLTGSELGWRELISGYRTKYSKRAGRPRTMEAQVPAADWTPGAEPSGPHRPALGRVWCSVAPWYQVPHTCCSLLTPLWPLPQALWKDTQWVGQWPRVEVRTLGDEPTNAHPGFP